MKIDGEFTRTQGRMVDLLRDQKAHTLDELMACIDNDLASRQNLRDHICKLRKNLPLGIVLFSYSHKEVRYYKLGRHTGGRDE